MYIPTDTRDVIITILEGEKDAAESSSSSIYADILDIDPDDLIAHLEFAVEQLKEPALATETAES